MQPKKGSRTELFVSLASIFEGTIPHLWRLIVKLSEEDYT
jgi:hypothetical protein